MNPVIYRIWNAIRWRAAAAGYRVWARVFATRYLRRVEAMRGSIDVRAAAGSVLFFSGQRVVKASVGQRGGVIREYEKYRLALGTWPELEAVFVPMRLRSETNSNYLIMDRCTPCPHNLAAEYALRLYAFMRSCHRIGQVGWKINSSPQIRAGLETVAALYGQTVARSICDTLARNIELRCYDSGFAHGDFHPRNIVLDSRGHARLIDFDCVRLNGILQLDAVNFVIEMEWARSGRPWFRQIPTYLRGGLPQDMQALLTKFGVGNCKELLALYALDRVGQEVLNYAFAYLRSELDETIEVLTKCQI